MGTAQKIESPKSRSIFVKAGIDGLSVSTGLAKERARNNETKYYYQYIVKNIRLQLVITIIEGDLKKKYSYLVEAFVRVSYDKMR